MTPGRRRLSPDGLDDLQAGVTRAINHRFGHYLFVSVDTGDGGRALLRQLVPEVMGARHWGPTKPALVRNVAISAAGLRRLGVAAAVVDGFGPAFAAGMAARAVQVLGDTGPSDPAHWEPAFQTPQAHLLVWLHGADSDELQAEATTWRERAADAGLSVVHEQEASGHPGLREHFGFADGAGQPFIDGVERRPGQTGTVSPMHNRPLAAGEFVLGYADALGVVAPAGRTALGRNGTLLVMRKLAQDVATFRTTMAAVGASVGLPADTLAAKLVGRWQDGTPLVLWPESPPGPDGPDLVAADFDFSDDPLGARCPLGAHIRRANPRDMLASPKMTTRHRIVRRAMPYGTILPEGQPDDGVERGLMFGCLNASIERQFEFVAQNWLNSGSRLGRGDERDPLVGAPGGSGEFVIGGYPPRLVEGLESFVTTRGGEYYLLPGRSALTALAWS